VNRFCQAAGVSRAGYYRFLLRTQTKDADMNLRSKIQNIALHWPAYGYRRVHRELIRCGWSVNHKRVLRLMRVDNLLCLRRRKFILTTDSKHGLPTYPNLAKALVLTSINQLWVADIHSLRSGVRVLGGSAGRFLAQLHWLGFAVQFRSRAGAGSLAHGAETTSSAAWFGAPLRPRRAICGTGLHGTTGTTWHSHQHEPAGKCL